MRTNSINLQLKASQKSNLPPDQVIQEAQADPADRKQTNKNEQAKQNGVRTFETKSQ